MAATGGTEGTRPSEGSLSRERKAVAGARTEATLRSMLLAAALFEEGATSTQDAQRPLRTSPCLISGAGARARARPCCFAQGRPLPCLRGLHLARIREEPREEQEAAQATTQAPCQAREARVLPGPALRGRQGAQARSAQAAAVEAAPGQWAGPLEARVGRVAPGL